MDWTAGYASDIEYTAGFYREQSPSFLNFVCVLNGYEPIPLDKPFTYCELGFGRGLTVSLVAAANPQGQFYAADFNPSHVAGARELTATANLNNLTLLENSFEELANGAEELPKFDFITLHGIYTWVTRENQQHITSFINRYLKPGGIVFLSYNAMPGWAPALPLQRLLVEFGDSFPNRSDVQIKGAAALVARMEAVKPGYLTANPGLAPRLKMLQAGNTNYLVHEYMHKHWQPLYHADVARDLSAAKLDFVGVGDLALAYPSVFLTPDQIEIINTMTDATMRETMKDYFLNTGFRKDVFVRGSRKMNPLRHVEALGEIGMAMIVPRDKATAELKLSVGTVNGKESMYIPLFDALAQRPHTFLELRALPGLEAFSLGDFAQAAAFLAMTGQAEIFFSSHLQHDSAPARRLNEVVGKLARQSDEWQALSSPLLGTGVNASFIERLVFSVLVEAGGEMDDTAAVDAVARLFRATGRIMIKDGQQVADDAANMAELRSQALQVLNGKRPLWRQLGML